jgi:two-component system sensor histidine kinase UhpB
MKILTKSGEERWLDVSTSRLDGRGTPATLGVAIDISERKRQEEQLRNLMGLLHVLAGRLQSVREEEKTRLAREMHDQIGQTLTAIKIDLGRVLREIESCGRPALSAAHSISKLIDQAILDVRRMATDLRPGVLNAAGLPAALEWSANDFQARTGIKCHVVIQAECIRLEMDRATAVFRIFQEALTNVARHSGASELYVRLCRRHGRTVLEVRDNGVGIPPGVAAGNDALGILGMRERALALGGQFQIVGRRRQGTTVTLSIPSSAGAVRTQEHNETSHRR